MQLTEEQRTRIMRLKDTLAKSSSSGEAVVIGPAIAARFFEALHALLAAHNAGAQEPAAYMWRDGGAWELTFDEPPPSATKSVPLYAHPQPITDAARDAVELLRKFMEYRDSDYVPNVLFDRARTVIDNAEIERLDRAKGE